MIYHKAIHGLPMIAKHSLFFYYVGLVNTMPGQFKAHSQVMFCFYYLHKGLKVKDCDRLTVLYDQMFLLRFSCLEGF